MASTEFKNNVVAPASVSINGVVVRASTGIPLAATGANGDLHIDGGAGTTPGYRAAVTQRQGGAYRAVAG